MSDEVKLVLLGTGAAIPSKERTTSALALIREGEIILCDCGEATQLKITQAGLAPSKIHTICISHLHGDHFFGLPGFLTTQQMLGRTAPLTLYGPPGLRRFMHCLARITRTQIDFPFNIVELDAAGSTRFRSGAFDVQAAPLDHNIPCLGFRFQEGTKPGRFNVERAEALGLESGPLRRQLVEGRPVRIGGRTIQPGQVLGAPQPGRCIAYCTDTRPCEAGIELARGADLLIHDSTFPSSEADLASRTGHSTAAQAAGTAVQANAGALVLWHLSSRIARQGEKELLEEAREIFSNSELARDLLQIQLPRRSAP